MGAHATGPRRFVIAAVVAMVVAGGLLLLRSATRSASDERTKAAMEAGDKGVRALGPRPVYQRPTVALVTAPPGPATPVPAPAGAFEGRVVSALTGAGLPGAQLTFARAEETSTVTAGPDGVFRFDARVSGRWFLAAATAHGHRPFAPEWGQSPVQLEARAGEIVRGITVALLPVEEYEGRVFDDEGKPIAGAEIAVLGGGAGGTTLVPLRNRYRSDASGSFRFDAPEGAVLEARREGFATGRAQVDYAVRVSRRLTIELKATSASAAPLAIDGVVEDSRGSPAEGATVSALPKAKVGSAPASARTDAQGRFRLTDVEAGFWILVASRTGAAPAFAEVKAGATGIRLRLQAGGHLKGRVRDRRTGAPVTLFTVLVDASELRSASVVDPAGRYEIDGLAVGPAVVSVVAPGYAPSSEVRFTVPELGATPATVDFDLAAGGRLAGVVVERGSGHPIAGAAVEVEGMSASLGVPVRNETVADAEGRFELGGLGETAVSISASAPDHHARVVAVPPIPDGETRGPVTIELTPLAPGEEPRVELAGIGAMLEKHGDAMQITMVAPGGGAAEVGLAPGDEVLSIDGAPVKPMTLRDVVALLRGPEGSTVMLVVTRPGAPGTTITVNVPRRLVRG